LKTPIIYSVDVNSDGSKVPVFAQGDYDVFVGALEEDKLPMYVVINRNTGVVEFTCEVTMGYLTWLDSITEAMDQRTRRQAIQSNADTGQIPLNFSFKN